MINEKFKRTFIVALSISIISFAFAWIFSAMAGETPKGTLKKFEARVNGGEQKMNHEVFVALADIDKLEVESANDNIELRMGDGDQVQVEFAGTSSEKNPIQVETKDGVAKIVLKKNQANFRFSFTADDDGPDAFGLRVTIPRKFEKAVSISSGSGDITARALKLSELSVQLGSGDIDLNESEIPSAILKTASGDVEVGNYRGKLEVSNVSGDIEIERFDGASLDMSTVSGDIEVSDMIANSVSGKTVSGDITVKPSDTTGWKFALNATSGDIENSIGTDESATKTMSLRTTSGDIHVNK